MLPSYFSPFSPLPDYPLVSLIHWFTGHLDGDWCKRIQQIGDRWGNLYMDSQLHWPGCQLLINPTGKTFAQGQHDREEKSTDLQLVYLYIKTFLNLKAVSHWHLLQLQYIKVYFKDCIPALWKDFHNFGLLKALDLFIMATFPELCTQAASAPTAPRMVRCNQWYKKRKNIIWSFLIPAECGLVLGQGNNILSIKYNKIFSDVKDFISQQIKDNW